MPHRLKALLGKCVAVTFSQGDAGNAVLMKLAADAGFSMVTSFPPKIEIPSDRLIFFLVDDGLPERDKRSIIAGIRGSEHTMRRFAPLVSVVAKGPRYQIVRLVQMGFDEVVFLGDNVVETRTKFCKQMNKDLLYIKAEHYFGPDRRRIERVDPNDTRRKNDGTPFLRLNVNRDPDAGIKVVSLD